MHGVENAGFVARIAQVARVARLAPGLDQRAVWSVLMHATVAVAIGDVDVAGGCDADVGWMVKRPAPVADAVEHGQSTTGGERSGGLASLLRVAGVARLVAMTECEAVPPGFVELEDNLRIAVDEVQRVIWGDAQAVGVLEETVAPGVEQLARLVEDAVGVFGTREDVDVVSGVDGNRANLAPHPARRELAPTTDELILPLACLDH